jgi:hypothetical protein
MENENQVIEEALNTSEVAAPNTENQETEVEQTEESSEVVEEVVAKSEYDKVKELADNYKIRAEKAEKAAKQVKPEKPAEQSSLSQKDLLALVRANVDDEDVDEVTEYAKFKRIPVSEALKSDVVKNLLANRAENRKVQAAANVTTTRRTTGSVSGESLLRNAQSKGEIPDDTTALDKLIEARQNAKRKQ